MAEVGTVALRRSCGESTEAGDDAKVRKKKTFGIL